LTIERQEFPGYAIVNHKSSIVNPDSAGHGETFNWRRRKTATYKLGCGVGSEVLPFLRRYIDD
jgi:hypothetical protein